MMIKQLCLAIAIFCLPQFTLAHAAPASGNKSEMIDPVARKISGSQDYVPFFGLRTTVTSGFSVAGYMTVDAGLHVEKSKIRKRLQAIRPRIFDAMRMAVTGYANGRHRVGEVPNIEMIRGRMQRVVDKQLGPGNATVVMASVMMFPAN
jgi:hypothetical protein